jgi:FkbM family methyltransferase
MDTIMRFSTFLAVYMRDLRASIELGADVRSCVQLMIDFTLSKFIGLFPNLQFNQLRHVCLRGNIKIAYRLNKGDLHSIREIWFAEEYWLPFESPGGILLDLGANIGMASLWLSKKYAFTQVIAVEPDPTNAEVVRDNFRLNSIDGKVLQAAIGPNEGTSRFESSRISNLGRLSANGSPVQVCSVNSIIEKYSIPRFALIKIDIEGGEQPLFDGPTEWLDRTDAIIMELHPAMVDCDRLVKRVASHGFNYIPAHSCSPDNLPCFTRVRPAESPTA